MLMDSETRLARVAAGRLGRIAARPQTGVRDLDFTAEYVDSVASE